MSDASQSPPDNDPPVEPTPEKAPVFARARKDLDAGRPDKARDRLTGYLYTLARRGTYDEAAYGLLGEAYWAMKDLPKAGAAWLLTSRGGEDVARAIAALYERHGRDPAQLLRIVKPRAPSELYPDAVKERLRAWSYRYLPYRPRSNPHAGEELPETPAPKGLHPIEIGCAIIALSFTLFALAFLMYAAGML